jgi:beta-galactosidase
MSVVLRERRIEVDGRPEILLAGEVHYFRLAREDWDDRLAMLSACGCDTVATYVPWLWHELPDGTVDLHGRTHPQRDLAGFLDLAHRRGLRALVRPGPFVMAELKNEGIPYRVYAEAPQLLPTTWDGATVTSRTVDYLAPAFTAAVEQWYAAVLPVVAARLHGNGGPVVGVQLDNEIGMLSWVTNQPDLTDLVCADLARWVVARHGAEAAAARVGAHPDDAAAWASALRHPAEEHTLAVHHDLGRYSRDRYRRYVAFLRGLASRHGIAGVPLLVNLHGTDRGRGRTFPIGISQLAAAYRDQPQLTSGSDHYLGDLTVENVADLYVGNAFMAAVHGPDQPLTSLEFEAGTGDHGEDLARLVPPEAVDLKVRLCVAQGNRLLNFYLFTGGQNPPLAEPVGDGNDRISFTGQRHGVGAPVDPEGRPGPSYPAMRRVLSTVRAAADLLASSVEEHDGLALAFVPDHYLTEYHHPASAARAAQVDDLERFRGMGPRDVLARALLLGGLSFPAVDLQDPDAALPPVLALGSPSTLDREVQVRLVDHLRAGGRLLLHGVVPDRDADGMPCTVLAEALGAMPAGGGRHDATVDHFPSVVGERWAADEPEVRVGYTQPLRLTGGAEPLLREVGTGLVCGAEARVGAGRALVLACDYPCRLGFWRRALESLGVRPRLRHTARWPGLVTTSTVDPSGQRLLHLVNVAPYPMETALSYGDTSVLGGRPLRVPARAGLMLPYGVRLAGGTLVETTCELVARDDVATLLRPTQEVDVVVLETPRRVSTSRGAIEVDGTRVTVTVDRARDGAGPLRLTLT